MRLAEFILRRPRWILIAFALISLALGVGLTRLRVDNSLDPMYPDGSPVTALRGEVARTFGAGKLLVAVVEGDIYTAQGLTDLGRLTDAVHEVPGIGRVTSAANAQLMQDDDGLLRIEDLVNPDRLAPQDIAAIREELRTSELYGNGLLVNDDGTAATVVIEVDENADTAAAVDGVQQALAANWPGHASLAGGPLVEVEMGKTVRRDLPLLAGLAAAMIVVMLFLNFRTAQGALLPLLTIAVGLEWSMGAMGWLGGRITTLNIIGPVAILAVGSSFSLHLLGRYVFELGQGASKRRAIALSVGETGLGVLISGIAIAAAMGTFTLSRMPTVRVLGLLTGGGVLAALLASLLLLPAMLRLLPPPRHLPDAHAGATLGPLLRRLARGVAARRWPVVIAALVLVAVSGVCATRIVPNTAVLSYFRKDSPVTKSYEVVERTFGGSSQVQVRVQGDIQDPELLRAMLAFQARVEAIPGVGSSTSIANVLRAIHQALTGEDALPATREAVAQELLVYQLSGDMDALTQFMTLDGRQALVTITNKSASTAQIKRIDAAIRQAADETLASRSELGYTGLSLLQLAIEDSLLHDFILSLTLALALVIVIDSMVRSIAAALVTIVALLATIALQYGVLGALGLPLDLATMLLGALAIGVGDYAIHLTVRYMEERRRTGTPEEAMERAIVTSGRSIAFTALTLGAGFASMTVSHFVPIRTLGALMTFTVASVGIMSLTLLPAACLIFLRNPRSPRTSQEVARHA